MTISGQYLTFSEYQSLGGTLTETPFSILEYNARKKIDERTFGRLMKLDTQPEEVKMCVFNLVNTLESYGSDNPSKKNVASENIDGYSISYKGADKSVNEAMNVEINDIIDAYLRNTIVDKTPVLYRGVK